MAGGRVAGWQGGRVAGGRVAGWWGWGLQNISTSYLHCSGTGQAVWPSTANKPSYEHLASGLVVTMIDFPVPSQTMSCFCDFILL